MAKDLSHTRFREGMQVQVPYSDGLVVGTLIDPRRPAQTDWWLVRFEDPAEGLVTLAYSECDMMEVGP